MRAELYILGVLHRGDMHPYEIKRRLAQAKIECITDMDTGTLYYAVKQLADKDFVSAVAEERVPRGGVRTVYRITEKGRQRFMELLHQQFAASGDLQNSLYGPMLFLHLADPKLVASALRIRLEKQKERLSEIAEIRKRWNVHLPTGSRLLLDHMVKQCRMDSKWLSEVIEEIENGRVSDTDDPLRLAAPR